MFLLINCRDLYDNYLWHSKYSTSDLNAVVQNFSIARSFVRFIIHTWLETLHYGLSSKGITKNVLTSKKFDLVWMLPLYFNKFQKKAAYIFILAASFQLKIIRQSLPLYLISAITVSCKKTLKVKATTRDVA